jgi:hypothetical protein
MVPLSLLKYLHAVKRVIPPELRGINPKPSMSGGRWPASLPNSLAKENIKLLFGGHTPSAIPCLGGHSPPAISALKSRALKVDLAGNRSNAKFAMTPALCGLRHRDQRV